MTGTNSRDKLRGLFLAAIMVLSVVGGTIAFSGGVAAAGNASVSVGNTPVTPTSVNDNVSFDASIDYNITGVDTSDGTDDGLITVEFDGEFDLSSSSVSTVAVDSTGTDSNTTNVATNTNYTANEINITVDDSGGMAGDTLRVQLDVAGLSASAGDGSGNITTSIDADASSGYEVSSSPVGSITINNDTTEPSVAESTTSVTDENAVINVSVSDGERVVDEGTIDVNVTNSQTDETYSIVENGTLEMGTALGAANFTDGSDNATEYVNVSVPLQEGNYTIGVSAADSSGNTVDETGVGDGFTVDMAGDSLKVIADDTNPQSGTAAGVDVVAVDANGNELLFDDTNVGTTASNIQLSFDDPENVTLSGPTGSEFPINHSADGYNVTFDVTYSEIGDLEITASDFSGNLTQGTDTQTYTSSIEGVEVTAADGTLTADDQDTETVSLQLVDGDDNPVERAGETVSWGIISGNKGDAGVTSPSSMISTNSSGIATISYQATNAGYTIEVAGEVTSTNTSYSDTASFNTTPGDVSATQSSATLSAPANPQVATEHTITATIEDSQGNTLTGVDVAFSSNNTNTSFAQASGTTNESGQFSTTVTLPEQKDTLSINVTAGAFNASETSDAQFNVTTKAANATELVFTSDSRTVPSGTSKTVTAEVLDEYGNVNMSYDQGITLTSSDVTVLDFSGSNSSTVAPSDSGPMGEVNFTVSANATSGSATLTATSDNLTEASDSFTIGSAESVDVTFAHPISTSSRAEPTTTMYAQLLDSSGEPFEIANENITFAVQSGDAAVLNQSRSDFTANTNSSGIAMFQVNATSNTGETTFYATADNFTAEGTGTVTTTGPATSIAVQPAMDSVNTNTSVDVTVAYTDSEGREVPKTTQLTLKTNRGQLDSDASPQSTKLTPSLNVDGASAMATLNSSEAGTATLTAIGGGVTGSAPVEYTEPTGSFEVSDLSPQNVTVTQGETINVSATITNTGAVEDTQTVEFRVDGTELANKTVSLNVSENATVEFTGIDTGALDAGTYTHGVYTTADNQTAMLTVQEPAAFNVSYSVDDSTVLTGEDVTVTATVENTGDVSGSTDVWFYADGEEFYNESVTVDGGNTITVDAATSFATAGDHNVTVNDLNVTEITAQQPATYEVTGLDAPENVSAGDTLTVTATIENVGDVAGNQSVMYILGTEDIQFTQNVELDAGNSTQVTFEANTTGIAAGTYTHGVYTDADEMEANLTVQEPTQVPVVVGDTPAKDTDGDGLYENVNGDEAVDARDVLALWNNRNSVSLEYFNFNGDDVMDARDVLALWNNHVAES